MTEQERIAKARLLKPARVRQGLRQQDVAEQAGIARNTYAAMESGKLIPQAAKLWAAMLVLGLQPTEEDPEWLREWWAVMRPLILNLPEETRGETMGRVIQVLVEGGRVEPQDADVVEFPAQPSPEDFERMAALDPGYSVQDQIDGENGL